jgi:L-lactate dehydrogenase
MATDTVGIVGTGQVGVAAAYALFQRQIASRLVLLDLDRRRAEGEAMDLMHGQALVGRVSVQAGDYVDLAGCRVVVICAGVGQRPGETRLELLNRNAAVFGQLAGELDRHVPDAVLVVATNPVDILTTVLQRLSSRPPERVIGTGTMLDTSRFRALLGEHYGVNPRSVHAYILGEHGDSEVPIWSSATIGGLNIVGHEINGRPFDARALERIFERVRGAAYDIIERKGYTNTAIGLVIAYLVRVILEDQMSVLPVSVDPAGACGITGLCLSIPCVIGGNGVEALVPPRLSPEETEGLTASAGVLARSLAGMTITR